MLTPQILRFESLPSTNVEAAKRAVEGAPEGLCIVAAEQTAGRGRLQRHWVSPKDAGLYFSIILRPQLGQSSWPLLTLMAAVAVRDALLDACALETDIKWPNDILADEKKLCGILAETVETSLGRAVVVGIGINLTKGSFPRELEAIATDVETAGHQKPELEVVLEALTRALVSRYDVLNQASGPEEIIREWCAGSSYGEGKLIRVNASGANEGLMGTTRGLERDGALRVETHTGEIKVVRAGDVTSVRSASDFMIARKRIVLTTLGSYGDIHPYMAIARELRARGHQPVIATSELYREKMEASGFEFAAVRPNIPPPQEQDPVMMEKVMEPRSGSGYLLNEMLFPFVREGYEDLLHAVKGADLLLTHPISFAGPLVAQTTGIPWISSVLAPVSFFSPYDPPVPPFWPWMRLMNILGPRFLAAFFNQFKNFYKNEHYEQFRKELGLPDRGSPIFEGAQSPSLVLALFSRLFAQPQPDWPVQTRVTGFAFYDGGDELEMPPELVKFLDEGAPPIVFTLGTSAVWVARDFYRQSIAAARLLGRRAVLLIGDDRNRLEESLPPGMIAVNYAPFEALLARACAMVHHGGVGTTSQGLRAGIPTLIVPFAFDQPDNAAHAARLGGSRTLPRGKYQAARVAKELGILLTEPGYATKANEIGKLLQRENGAAAASDLIEQVLRCEKNVLVPQLEEPAYAASH